MLKTYRKTMTRDHGFLAQEAWSYSFEELAGVKNPYSPSLVYQVIDGAAEIWEQDKAFKWFTDSLLKINQQNFSFFNESLKEYQRILKKLKLERKVLSLHSLKQLSADFHSASKLFVVLYYSAYDERTPKKIRAQAEEPKPKTSRLKGQVACPGFAQGVVRILRRVDQVKGFKKGEILVSPMTIPDFISAMKRAAAIVTDEGGITCHAAIVSRELNKPCLIATKFTTEIFKDGDLAEVDADQGIVKIL